MSVSGMVSGTLRKMNDCILSINATRTAEQPDEPEGKRDRRTRLHFNSIVFDLQIKIAEKIDYFDQMECQFSSKHGRDIVNSTKHKAVVKVDLRDVLTNVSRSNSILGEAFRKLLHFNSIEKGDIFLFIDEHSFGKKVELSWKKIRHTSELPRFRIPSISIFKPVSYLYLTEIEEKAGFVTGELDLSVAMISAISVETFSKLPEIFEIRSFHGKCEDPALFCLSRFQKIRRLSLGTTGNIPDEAFRQLKATEMNLCRGATPSTVNVLLSQWFRKERDIARLTALNQSYAMEKESIFSDIPYSLVVQVESDQEKREFWLRKPNSLEIEKNSLSGFVCSIDRGDKKLLVIFNNYVNNYRPPKGVVTAQEYSVLEDIFGFQESDINRINNN